MWRCVALSFLLVSISSCGLASMDPALQSPDGALQATRDWNDFMERTLHHIHSIPNDEGRKRFVNGLKPTMEAEFARWKKRYDAERDRGTLRQTLATPSYKHEASRGVKLAPELTRELEKYVDKTSEVPMRPR